MFITSLQKYYTTLTQKSTTNVSTQHHTHLNNTTTQPDQTKTQNAEIYTVCFP